MSLRSQRPALGVLALIAVLAVGFLLGSVVRLSSGSSSGAPAGDSVDVGFAQDMSVHHLQAVQLANIALSGSADPVVRSLAFDISSTQQVQVGQLQGWLSLWGQPLLRTGGYMGWMTDAAMQSTATGPAGMAPMTGMQRAADGTVAVMPGMASAQELTQLRATTGPQLDVGFLQLMLRHHQGGAEMLTYAARSAVEPVVRTFAGQVAATQDAEVTAIQQLLGERGAQPLPLTG